jgi:transcriptional regulator with XRE-family HTH domain
MIKKTRTKEKGSLRDKAKSWVWLAKETGLTRPTLYETLNGTTRPRIDTLTKILGALGFKMLFVAVDNTKTQETKKLEPRKKATRHKTQNKKVLDARALTAAHSA